MIFTLKQWLVFLAAALVTVLVTFSLIPYFITHASWGWAYNTDTGFIGDTIGGTVGPVVGFIGVILTFFAFYIQYQANEMQRKAIEKQEKGSIESDRLIAVRQIEGTFFELLKFHRENVREMKFRDRTGSKVLITILYQYYKALHFINNDSDSDIQKLPERDKINIAYLITYFGVYSIFHNPLEDIILKYYANLHKPIMRMVVEIKNSIPAETAKHNVYDLTGHQSRLGHYYRHLFMIVTFIHENKVLNNEERYKYIKFLRVQLSTQEQILFFFNSLSILGQSWELGPNVLPDNKLITKYQLIRNIPSVIKKSISPRKYYPDLKLEQDF